MVIVGIAFDTVYRKVLVLAERRVWGRYCCWVMIYLEVFCGNKLHCDSID